VLELREGDTVVDLGSGAGYFALKLSPIVGKRGQVLAVDLRRLSLLFLSTRTLLRGQHNVHVIVGAENNPRLPTGAVDAVLICITFHEFGNPELMLDHIFRSLRPGGHLVVVDRAPRATEGNTVTKCLPQSSRASYGRRDSRSSGKTLVSLTGLKITCGGW
jgi:ubiquinone/menaquinone biosynthesis C-methylase UbiE